MNGRIFKADKSFDAEKADIIGTYDSQNMKRRLGAFFCSANHVKKIQVLQTTQPILVYNINRKG